MESGAPGGIVDAWLYSSKQAAALLGVTRADVQRAVARGLLPFVEGTPPGTPRLGLRGSDLRAFAAHAAERVVETPTGRAPAAPARETEHVAAAGSAARIAHPAPAR